MTGSRAWSKPADVGTVLGALYEALQLHPDKPPMTVIHGDCPRGADKFADQWAVRAIDDGKNVVVERYPADWETYGKSAGFKRNTAMVETGVDVCVAFFAGKSRGTWHCYSAAKRAGVSTVEYHETAGG